MISRGEVGLIVAGYGLTHAIIGRDVFSAAVVMVLVTTMVTPPLLRLTFPARRGTRAVVEETIAGPPEEAGMKNQDGVVTESVPVRVSHVLRALDPHRSS